jgi:serine/threonine protein kinase
MSKRAPAAPPAIPGYQAIELIGVGGYADVFLYEQEMPRRRVAVKVLVKDSLAGDAQRRQFSAEANLMARVSAHPYIVSIFHAAITADGRPFIVMEHYPGANFLERVRREHFSVAEVLRTGIQIASAVETAHRAGILHRDIKPANILTSEYGRPGLTDFGIAGDGESAESEGLSVPWAPPEAFGIERLDERADVYSLGATIYHLLAGRSPFEVSGGDNGALALMSRIEKARVPDVGRPDVPASLERILTHALAKRPELRPSSAAELGRLLQSVEAELNLSTTHLELAEDRPSARLRTDDADDDSTRIRGVHTIDAQMTAPPSGVVISSIPTHPTAAAPVLPRERHGLLAEPEIESTIVRGVAAEAPLLERPAQPGRRKWVVPVASTAAVLVLVVIGVLALTGGKPSSSDTTTPEPVNDGVDDGGQVVARAPGSVESLVGTANADGTYTFTWSPPQATEGDLQYQVTEVETADSPREAHNPQTAASFVSTVPCIEVSAVLSNLLSPPVPKCAGA